MVLVRDEAQVEANFVLLGDRCMVGAKHTIGSKILLVAPDGTTR